MKKFLIKILRVFSSIIIKQNDPELIKKLRQKFTHNERSFVYGGIKYLVDSLYCHASPGVLEIVCLELDNILKNKKISGNKLLNVGGGQVSVIYEEIGFDVYNLDIGIVPDKKNILFNLNNDEPIPLDEKSFDVIVCQEVIEHIENPWKLFKNAKRLLKDDGVLIVTTPNILSLQSKILFIFTGYFKWFTPECFDYHINPIPAWEIKLISDRNNFKIYSTKGSGDYFFKRNNQSYDSIVRNNETLISFLTNNK